MDIKLGDEFIVLVDHHNLKAGYILKVVNKSSGYTDIDCADTGGVTNYADYYIENMIQNNYWWEYKPWTIPTTGPDKEILPYTTGVLARRSGITVCEHEYKLYEGLTQSYRYCTKCDKKESNT